MIMRTAVFLLNKTVDIDPHALKSQQEGLPVNLTHPKHITGHKVNRGHSKVEYVISRPNPDNF